MTTAFPAGRRRQIPRPVPIATPAVRHDVMARIENDESTTLRQLHAGIAIPAEAQIRFREACEHAARRATTDRVTITLERHTVETLAVRHPNGDTVKAAETAVAALERAAPTIREGLERMGRAWADALAEIAAAMEAQNKARAMGRMTTGLEGVLPVVVLFDIAASHQGGHSRSGRLIAGALGVPFPITMPELGKRALEVGLEPRELWPWWGSAPRTMGEARTLLARANAPEFDLCEGGCGRLAVEPCACPAT